MTISFDDRVAIVTGAGRGLGRAYAIELARRGARVVVNDVGSAVDGSDPDMRAADAVVAEIEDAGGTAVASHHSIADPDGGAAVVELAVAEYGSVDIVVNNAGILRDRSFANLTADDVTSVLDVHLRGAFWVSMPAFRIMKERGHGRFVFTSSNSGLLGNFGQANYGAAKMGLVGLSNVLAIEGAKYGITSNVIAPVAGTRMTKELLGPLADLANPSMVMPMVVYLCSDENQLTHEIFTAGGGRFARFFVGLGPGWFAGAGSSPTVEDVADHIEEIRTVEPSEVLVSSFGELELLGRMLAGGE